MKTENENLREKILEAVKIMTEEELKSLLDFIIQMDDVEERSRNNDKVVCSKI